MLRGGQGPGSQACPSRAGLGTRERPGFCLASHALCSALRSLTWRRGKRNLRRWLPASFVVAHLLVNRYKLLVLETLAAPLLIKPLQLIIIFSLESLRGKQRRRRGRLPFLPEARCPGRPGSHALGRGQQPEPWEKQRGSRLRRAKPRAPEPSGASRWESLPSRLPCEEPGAQGHAGVGGGAGLAGSVGSGPL